MTYRLSIIVVEKDRDRALLIVDALASAGDHDIHVIAEETSLARRVAERRPDLVLIDLANPSRDVLEDLTIASGAMDRPVAMFVERSDSSLTRATIEAGVSAYVVDGLRADRIKPILDAAIARFHVFQRMRVKLAATKSALEDRKIIDRAKGSVMRAKGIGEEQAYALIRKAAMGQGKRIADMAPLAIAKEKGFFEDEGLFVTLEAQSNWKELLDRVIGGELDGAHMLAGQLIAATIGYGTKGP